MVELNLNFTAELRRLDENQWNELCERITFANMVRSKVKTHKKQVMEILGITSSQILKDYTNGAVRLTEDQLSELLSMNV